MNPGFHLYPSGAGLLLAAAAVVAGAPLFSGGLRALRLRRLLAALRQVPLGEAPAGFVHVRGAVALESPMFAPLSGSPCAGFRLEVHPSGYPAVRAVEEHRHFRLHDDGRSARVLESGARWDVSVTAEREVAADEAPSERLSNLLARVPEAVMARRAGRSLRLVERALPVGAECHVVGHVRHARFFDLEPEVELMRTGTDDISAVAGATIATAAAGEPELCIGGGEQLDFMLVSDHAPTPALLAPPAYHVLGVALGPALSMAGLVYLASALEALRGLARF